MRIYRLEIRIIQLSILLTVIVMVFGIVSNWQGKTSEPVPANAGAQVEKEGDAVIDGKSDPSNTRIVCLGDSFTVGWPGQLKDSWPQKVAETLKVEVINSGKTFQNTSDLLTRFDTDVVAHNPGRVIIFAGVGDALRGKTLAEYQTNIMALIEKAKANHIKPILALPIPYPDTDELYNEYRKWEEGFAAENKIFVLDFKSVLFDSEGKILKKYSDDGRYPNNNGYQAMGEYAARIL